MLNRLKRTRLLAIFVVLLMAMVIITGCTNSEETPNADNDSADINDIVDWSFYNERATAFVTATANGELEIAIAMFDETMSQLVSTDDLQAAWAEIIAVAGEFVEIYGIENGALPDGFYISGVIMRHENFGFGWNIVFSEDGLISGLNQGGTIPLSELTTQNEVPTAPIAKNGFTDYPVVIGEGTDFPLDGILSMPNSAMGQVPAVVIVQGSGPNDMDGSAALYIYRQIAEHLAENGVASIRHDKRTLTHGARLPQGFTIRDEAIYDAILATEMLRAEPRIDENRVYIIGHSLGGAIAPRIHAMGGDFAGLILMAGSPRDIFGEVMFEQFATAIVEAVEMGILDEAGANIQFEALQEMEELFASVRDMTEEEAKTILMPMVDFSANFQRDMFLHPFSDFVEDITVPILIMQGGRDFQVRADVDFFMLQEMFAGRDNATFKLYDDLNHAFVTSTATNFTEHGADMQTNLGSVDRQVLQDIVDWILSR